MKDGRTRRIEESEAFPTDEFFELNQVSLVVANGPYIAHHEFRPALSPEDAAILERLVL